MIVALLLHNEIAKYVKKGIVSVPPWDLCRVDEKKFQNV